MLSRTIMLVAVLCVFYCKPSYSDQLSKHQNEIIEENRILQAKLDALVAKEKQVNEKLNALHAEAKDATERFKALDQEEKFIFAEMARQKELALRLCTNRDVWQEPDANGIGQVVCKHADEDEEEVRAFGVAARALFAQQKKFSVEQKALNARFPVWEAEQKQARADKASINAAVPALTAQRKDINARWALVRDAKETRVRIQTKSYIGDFDTNEQLEFQPPDGSGAIPKAMATAVFAGIFGAENPESGSLDSGHFRLRSELLADITCRANTVIGWQLKEVAVQAGKEGGFPLASAQLVKPLTVAEGVLQAWSPAKTGSNTINFSYRMRGQPPDGANLVMNAAKKRSCTFIWHEIRGVISCSGVTPTVDISLSGSAFPSHKTWVSGAMKTQLKQGRFHTLWKCDPNDATSVQ